MANQTGVCRYGWHLPDSGLIPGLKIYQIRPRCGSAGIPDPSQQISQTEQTNGANKAEGKLEAPIWT